MLENKVSELEKRINKLEEENISTRKTLNELIYQYMNEIGTGESNYSSSGHIHNKIPRYVKKIMLKSLLNSSEFNPSIKYATYGTNRYTNINNNNEIIFGENYYDKLIGNHDSYNTQRDSHRDILEGFIDEMTDEECEIKLKEVFKADFERTIKRSTDDPKSEKKYLKRIIEQKIDYPLPETISQGSERLWTIFDKIKEEKELEKKQYNAELIKPYIEKLKEKIHNIEEEEQNKKRTLAKIKKKEAELEKLRREANYENKKGY